MRLTNINCPQCNGQLFQQEDKFYCSSCGSAFNIDYEEADVEYAKLVTEPERTRLLLENNRILLEKNEELRRKFAIGEIKREFVHQAKSAGVTYLGGLIYGAIIGGISFLAVIIILIAMFFNVSKNYKTESSKREQERNESLQNLSAEDIEKDRNFIENAVACGVAYEVSRRDEPVENKAEDGGDAYLAGTPAAVNCYFIKDGTENHLCIIYKITYEFSENNSLKEVYECVILDDLEPDGTGHVSFDSRSCTFISGSGSDHHWCGYESAEEAREYLLSEEFKSFKSSEIDI